MPERVVSRAAHYGRVPESLLLDTALSSEACRLYALLTTYDYGRTGKCWPGREEAAQRLSWGVRTVTRYLKELQDAGAILRRRQGPGEVMLIELLADVVEVPDVAGLEVPETPSRSANHGKRTSSRTRENESAAAAESELDKRRRAEDRIMAENAAKAEQEQREWDEWLASHPKTPSEEHARRHPPLPDQEATG